MIEFCTGNLLDDPAEALVNTVNCVGVMGKGLALQFRRAFPDAYAAYRRAFTAGELRPGRMHLVDRGVGARPRWIVNFPTKRHWRSRSRLDDIAAGLGDLAAVVRRERMASLAVPPLGCGNGGLDWSDVRPLIEQGLGGLEDVAIRVYEPAGPPAPEKMVNRTEPLALTADRAALVALIGRYISRSAPFRHGGLAGGAARIEIQKLAYFAHVRGVWRALTFEPGRYGPYSHPLDVELRSWEGHFTLGYGDGTDRVQELRAIQVLTAALASAEDVLGTDAERQAVVAAVLDLAHGWEQPYELDLLASVHWLAGAQGHRSVDVVAELVRDWGPPNAGLFTVEHVRKAWDHLADSGWLPAAG